MDAAWVATPRGTSWPVRDLSDADDPRVETGVVFIGSPDYFKLLEGRTAENKIPMEAPYVPNAFMQTLNRTNPANKPYTSYNPKVNPFWGKRIFAGSGAADPLVHFSYSSEFLSKLVLGPKGDDDAEQSLEVYVQPHVPHTVTNESTLRC